MEMTEKYLSFSGSKYQRCEESLTQHQFKRVTPTPFHKKRLEIELMKQFPAETWILWINKIGLMLLIKASLSPAFYDKYTSLFIIILEFLNSSSLSSLWKPLVTPQW